MAALLGPIQAAHRSTQKRGSKKNRKFSRNLFFNSAMPICSLQIKANNHIKSLHLESFIRSVHSNSPSRSIILHPPPFAVSLIRANDDLPRQPPLIRVAHQQEEVNQSGSSPGRWLSHRLGGSCTSCYSPFQASRTHLAYFKK